MKFSINSTNDNNFTSKKHSFRRKPTNNKNQFKCINLPFPIGDFSNIRITLDDYNDYKILKKDYINVR